MRVIPRFVNRLLSTHRLKLPTIRFISRILCVSCVLFSISPFFRQYSQGWPHGSPLNPLPMIYDLPTTVQSLPVPTEPTSPQACPRKEFNGLLIKSVSTHEEINLIPTIILGRLFTRSHILPPTYPNGSQVAVPTFPRHTFSMSYPVSLRQELYVPLQRSRVLSLGVICGLRVPWYFSIHFLFPLNFVTDPHGSTLCIFLYVSFPSDSRDGCDGCPCGGFDGCPCLSFTSFHDHSLVWHLIPPGSEFICNRIKKVEDQG
jgi:hypothetical protein